MTVYDNGHEIMGISGPNGKLFTWLHHSIVALLQPYFVQFE
jgi:hypothetical protein